MREWLLKLLGVPQPVVINLDVCAIAKAAPGDLVILRYVKPLRSPLREELYRWVEVMHEWHPGIKFLLLDDAWGQVVTVTGARA